MIHKNLIPNSEDETVGMKSLEFSAGKARERTLAFAAIDAVSLGLS